MNVVQKNITYYFRDAVVAQRTKQVEITEESIKITFDMLTTGKIDPSTCRHLFKAKEKHYVATAEDLDADIEEEKETKQIKIILALQVVNIKAEGGVKYESHVSDLTGTLFLPASLSDSGILAPETDNIPWIPRGYLSPVEDDVLIVGQVQSVDQYIAAQAKELSDIKNTQNWEQYMSFAKGLWMAVNGTELFGKIIYNYVQSKQPLFLDNFAYIIPDTTLSTTHHIKKLYEYALTGREACNSLYQTMIDMSFQAERPLIDNTLPLMMGHAGQMNGDFPLSPSQREAVNHFAVITDGEVLAVNGPPGTGKTTLLQTIVADMMVKHALKKDDAPIIVATSTNNQAVTNIIESFAASDSGRHAKRLDTHWIPKKNSFATYLPSKSTEENALARGYQVTDAKMSRSVSDWESQENRDKAIENVVACCEKFFGKSGMNLEQCEDSLHRMLVDFDKSRREILELAATIPFEINILSCGISQNTKNIREELLICQQKEIAFKNRLNGWSHLWHRLFFYRIFGFIPQIKKRIITKMFNFRTLDEGDLPEAVFTFRDVEKYYEGKLRENAKRDRGFKIAKNILEIASKFERVDINIFASKNETVALSLSTLNVLFDANIRFYEFWLSVHYYECKWLAGTHKVRDDELFKSTYSIMAEKYKRLCMLTPCLVMTFYMMPYNFSCYKDKYLYNFIDLLIVDEAGQVSPEIGAASFLLAKKALVVGDVYQIEPVWGVTRELDMALATDRGVVPAGKFHVLEENGLNTSESSLMKIASRACAYSKFGKKGLLLTEHRRCYNELISYCNELVYGGKLEPKRGYSTKDNNYPFPGQPVLEHVQISTAKSDKRKSSRYNLAEAQKIRIWLDENYSIIKHAYPDAPVDSLVCIITPFIAQAKVIRNELRSLYADILVGTVHTFQGGDRKLVLFSTVYGAEDGCAFLDYKPNLMNVAMSRAKDRFVVFGDINCLSTSRQKPSGLLRAYLSH